MNVFGKVTLKQVLYSAGLLLIVISIPLTVYLVNTKQIFKGKAAAPTFSLGFNATGITHYGYNEILPYAPASNIDTDLSEINRMGGKIIRIFVANNKITNEEAARRLDVFLTKAATYNISAIVSFINYYGDTGFNPQGTDKYYTDVWSGIPLLGDGFFAGGYKNEYLPFVQTVISANKNHTNIYAWEIGNELKDNNSSTNYYDFMKDVTDTIKSLDPVHDIATGNLNAGHASLTPEALYSLPNINIITIHNYNGSHDGLSDAQWGVAHGKKVILEEFGFSNTGDRTNLTKTEIDFWKSQGVSVVLQWGFLGKGMVDNGNGDTLYGMDTIWHTDYDLLANLYAVLNNVSLPSPTPTLAVTPTPTLPPSTWIINVEPVCSAGTILTGKTRIFYAIWPKYPLSSKLTWQNDDYAIGSHTQQIAATAPQGSDAIQGIYVGLETETGVNLTPTGTPPNPAITYANYFKILMAHWFYNELPSGTYDLKFNVPNSLCGSITPTPIQSGPSPTPIESGPTDSPTPISITPTILLTPTSVPISPTSPSRSEFDLNQDGVVNSFDVAALLKAWKAGGKNNLSKMDFNGDGIINSFDYSLLLSHF